MTFARFIRLLVFCSLATASANGQPVSKSPPPAADALRIGSWNIEHLGTNRPPQKADELVKYILASGVDAIALAEIKDDDQVTGEEPGKAPWKNKVLEEMLPLLKQGTGDEWRYELTDPQPINVRVQMTGVLWRTGRMTLVDRFRFPIKGGIHDGDPELTYWTRHPEAFVFRAGSVADKKTDFALVPLHMKSNSDGDAGMKMRKIEAEQLIEAMPAFEKKFPGEKDLVLLGDTNIKGGEQDVPQVWKDFKDLNSKEAATWVGNRYPPAPFDRIFVPKQQPEFSSSAQSIHGPYPIEGMTEKQWIKLHNKNHSDHILVWCDIQIIADDD